MITLVKQAEYRMDLTQRELNLFATLVAMLSPAQSRLACPDMSMAEVDALYEKLKDYDLNTLQRVTVSPLPVGNQS